MKTEMRREKWGVNCDALARYGEDRFVEISYSIWQGMIMGILVFCKLK